MSQIPFLTRLLAPKRPAFEFAFGLEPIVQLAALLFASFKIDFICATSDFLVGSRVPYRSLPRRRWVEVVSASVVPFRFGFGDILSSFLG
jgi:hypothetical protein